MTFLSQTQAELPSSIHLQSSSSLGTGKVTTHLERLERLEDKEVRRALDGRAGKRKRHDDIYAVTVPDDEDSEDNEMIADVGRGRPSPAKESSTGESKEKHLPEVASASAIKFAAPAPSAVGSALQRNPDGSVIAPKIRLKNNTKKVRKDTVSLLDLCQLT